MKTPYKLRNPRAILCTGFLFLILANLSNYLTNSKGLLPEGPGDAVSGFLFGIAIGCMLLGTWMNGRRRCGHSGGGSTLS